MLKPSIVVYCISAYQPAGGEGMKMGKPTDMELGRFQPFRAAWSREYRK